MEYLKFPLAGLSATPFLFVLAYLLRKTPYPNTLALVFLVIFGHLAAIIVKHWVHYQKEQMHFSVKLAFCLNPYVYLMVSNFYDNESPFNKTFNLITGGLQVFLGLLFLTIAWFLLKRELQVLKTPRAKGDKVSEQSYAAISLKGVGMSYGEKQVLREIDLQLRIGEVLALIGPNGAGKSSIT